MNNKKAISVQLPREKSTNNPLANFPSINFTKTSRALVALSKLQGSQKNRESNKIHANRQLGKSKSTNQPNQFVYNTEGSSINKFAQTHRSLSKISKTLYFVKKFEKGKTLPIMNLAKLESKINAHRYEEVEIENLAKNRQFRINQQTNVHVSGHVRFSDKKHGMIQGYAASSNVGTLYPFNNSRISISTNTVKISNKQREVGFFGLFQGRNGSNRAQYWRQHFHYSLINDQLFFYNTQKAISRTLQKLDRNFNYDPRYDGDLSMVYSVICLVVDAKMYIVRYGTPNATLSMNLGDYIKSMSIDYKQILLRQKKSLSSLSAYNTKFHTPKEQVHIRVFEIDESFDYLILGSEGLYQIINSNNQLGKTVWKYLLDEALLNQTATTNTNQGSNIKVLGVPNHKLAKVCSKVCQQAVKSDTFGRCMSMILISFSNLKSAFEEPAGLQLPLSCGMKHIEQNIVANEMYSQKISSNQTIQKQFSVKMRALIKMKQQQIEKDAYKIMLSEPRYENLKYLTEKSKYEVNPKYLTKLNSLL